MTAAETVETSVTTINILLQDFTDLDDQPSQTLTDTPGFKPFILLRSLARHSEQHANNYIYYGSNVRCIRQQIWFNHRCKDLGLVLVGLRIRSPINTQKAIQIDNSTSRRLIRATTATDDPTITRTNSNKDLTDSNNWYRQLRVRCRETCLQNWDRIRKQTLTKAWTITTH